MARKKAEAPTGAPDWLVTFADLMSLLVCFFVLIISFSIQDKEKMQVVAGSMREAFGVKKITQKAGIVEIDGIPIREFIKQVGIIEQKPDTDFSSVLHNQRRKQGPEANTHDIEKADVERPRQFATAAASLRQAWQEMPDFLEISQNILVEETEEGLNIQLVDQEGRSMFPEGSKYPHETARQLLAKMAPVIRQLPNRIRVTGHTSADQGLPESQYTAWELSSDRANAARRILAEFGVSKDRFHSIVGLADTDPLFPNDPYLSANRRLSILLIAEAPPLPLDGKL